MPKNAEEGKDVRIRATDAPNRYVPTSGIAENGCRQSTECRDRIRQTPRTKDNDCDVGTYRQVRPTFPKRADAKTMNGGFHIERCRKTRRKEKTCASGQRTHLIGTSLHPASRKTPAGSQRNAGIKNNIYSELNTNFNLYVSKRFFTRLNLIIKICIKICIKILTIRKKYRTFANQRCNKDEKIKGQTIINACCYC